MDDTTLPPVTVVGLGAMGTALARAFITAGHPTTVWNRTPERGRDLAAVGAAHALDLTDAVRASELVVVCLLDAAAVRAVLGPVTDHLPGRVVVDLTSATPEDAAATGAWVGEHGATYLEGAIMVPTNLVGRPEALVLFAGPRAAFDEHRPTLAALGGDADLVGEQVGLAAAYDLGMLGVFFSGMTSFLHASALLEPDGVSAERFRPYAERMTAILPAVFAQLARDVDARHHPGDQDRLVMDEAAIDHIVATSAARGVDSSLLEAVQGLARRAIADGHGEDGFSRLIDELRSAPTKDAPGRVGAR